VDVNFTVEEKPTGAVLVGAGFSTVDKLILQGSITQANVFGSGKFLSAQLNTGQVNKVASLSYVNPYYTVDGVSQGFDLYKRVIDASKLSIGPYKTDSLGGGLKFGYPLTENLGLSLGVNLEDVQLDTFENSPLSYLTFVNQFGNHYRYGALSAGISRDVRDSAIQPTSGSLTRASTEFAGGDLEYYRVGFQHQWYFPLSRTYTLNLNADLGYAGGLGGKPVPFFKNFYAGGPGSVRGFKPYTLGPQDVNGNVLGGTTKIVGSAEVLFPVPGAGQDKSLRLTAFVDTGWVYADGEKIDLGELRYAAGLGLAWTSPFGPLRISVAYPLNEKPGIDRVQRVQFTFGNVF